jgi:hypothetical protein
MSRTFFSLRRKRGSGSQHPVPGSEMSDARVSCFALWFLVLFCSISAVASSLVSDSADRFLKLASACGCTASTMVLSATRGLELFRVVREGIGLTQRLCASGTVCLPAIRMLTLEPERLKNQLATTSQRSPEMEGFFTRDAQAACDFSLSASKFFPFFQSVSVMAAILRANVSRTMAGLIPLASDLS